MTAIQGLFYGLDNAAVALALAPLLGWRRGLVLAALFGVSEMAMPFIGAAFLPVGGMADVINAGVLALLATTICGLTLARYDAAALVGSTPLLAALAFIMGLDNLVAGAEMTGAGASIAAVAALGIGSAVVAGAACALGVLLTRRLERRQAGLLSGAGLMALAAASLFA